jgi:hypothetical protein
MTPEKTPENRFAGKADEIEMLPPVKIETEDLTTDKQRRQNARFKAIMSGTEADLAPDIDKTIARMNSIAHNDGGSAPSDAGKSATKGSK